MAVQQNENRLIKQYDFAGGPVKVENGSVTHAHFQRHEIHASGSAHE